MGRFDLRIAKKILGLAMIVAALAGCSSVPNAINPVAWYRDLSGASKNDELDKNAPNQQNLEAGGKQPYPNLATVPDVPSTATGEIDRDALQKSLTADRSNAQYTDETLRAGMPPAVGVPAPPKPGAAGAKPSDDAAQQQAAATPAESPLASPTIPAVPQGEAPAAPPPPPNLHATPVPGSGATAAVAPAPAGRRRAEAQSQPVAAVAFAAGSTVLSDEERTRLSGVAAMQHKDGGALRVVGHAEEPAAAAAQQKLDSFTLALNRAKAVAQALAGEGVPQKAIAVEAVPSAGDDASTEVFLEH